MLDMVSLFPLNGGDILALLFWVVVGVVGYFVLKCTAKEDAYGKN